MTDVRTFLLRNREGDLETLIKRTCQLHEKTVVKLSRAEYFSKRRNQSSVHISASLLKVIMTTSLLLPLICFFALTLYSLSHEKIVERNAQHFPPFSSLTFWNIFLSFSFIRLSSSFKLLASWRPAFFPSRVFFNLGGDKSSSSFSFLILGGDMSLSCSSFILLGGEISESELFLLFLGGDMSSSSIGSLLTLTGWSASS